MCNIWGLRRFTKSSSILHQLLKSTLSPTLYPITDILTDSWVNPALFVLPVLEKTFLRDWLTGKRWCSWTLKREFVYGYEAGHPVWKTLCHKSQVSWFDIWQLYNIPAAFSSPNLPAVQLKMEMIYVPQRLTDWQAMQEGVGPHCDCGISKAIRRKVVRSQGYVLCWDQRDFSYPKGWAMHAQAWKRAGLWFLLKLKKKCTTPKGRYFFDL